MLHIPSMDSRRRFSCSARAQWVNSLEQTSMLSAEPSTVCLETERETTETADALDSLKDDGWMLVNRPWGSKVTCPTPTPRTKLASSRNPDSEPYRDSGVRRPPGTLRGGTEGNGSHHQPAIMYHSMTTSGLGIDTWRVRRPRRGFAHDQGQPPRTGERVRRLPLVPSRTSILPCTLHPWDPVLCSPPPLPSPILRSAAGETC